MNNMSTSAPKSICVLRLSALGDVSHVLAVVARLRSAYPEAKITWITGAFEQCITGGLDDVEIIVYNKKSGLKGFKALKKQLSDRAFDVLLHMQVSFRANALSFAIKAKRRIGFDRFRSRDWHGFTVNERIEDRRGEHVLDALMSFCEPLGLPRFDGKAHWPFERTDEADAFAKQWIPDHQPTLIISPCSSHSVRNWTPTGYAAVADRAIKEHDWRVLLCGGPSKIERNMGEAIQTAMSREATNIIGQDTMVQFIALMQRTKQMGGAFLGPDSGPMHLANAVGLPVIGLHAASNPSRSGPYTDRRFVVNAYEHAAQKFHNKTARDLPWGKKIEKEGVMELIQVNDVLDALDRAVLAAMRV